jgi:hypothetical protein
MPSIAANVATLPRLLKVRDEKNLDPSAGCLPIGDQAVTLVVDIRGSMMRNLRSRVAQADGSVVYVAEPIQAGRPASSSLSDFQNRT